ncbi:MAG: EF-P lysine aminoacylase GenX [Proteobacteria bacterium]|nr:EF-P lysine aminoacylase GenX [Pseudomonadota bacterium]
MEKTTMPLPTWHTLEQRALALSAIRAFFNRIGYLEIETRSMRNTTASDPYIESFRTFWNGEEKPYFLQTSPEYAHKILLSHHRHPIYEIARVFRNEPHGLLHRREFTLVEWYHPEYGYRDMMDETEGLIHQVSKALGTEYWHSNARESCRPISVDMPFERLSVRDAFIRYAGFSPIGMEKPELVSAALKAGCRVSADWSWNDIMNCVLVDCVEPHLGMERPTFLIDYPASMASLAAVRHDNDGDVAERFELYICGIELCNGYSELNDADELKRRFDEDNAERERLGLMRVPDDEALLAALPKLGVLGGNALGFERLLMLCLDLDDMNASMIEV